MHVAPPAAAFSAGVSSGCCCRRREPGGPGRGRAVGGRAHRARCHLGAVSVVPGRRRARKAHHALEGPAERRLGRDDGVLALPQTRRPIRRASPRPWARPRPGWRQGGRPDLGRAGIRCQLQNPGSERCWLCGSGHFFVCRRGLPGHHGKMTLFFFSPCVMWLDSLCGYIKKVARPTQWPDHRYKYPRTKSCFLSLSFGGEPLDLV